MPADFVPLHGRSARRAGLNHWRAACTARSVTGRLDLDRNPPALGHARSAGRARSPPSRVHGRGAGARSLRVRGSRRRHGGARSRRPPRPSTWCSWISARLTWRGLQICRTLRHHTLNRHVPIVIIAPDTALAAALTEIEHGADDFLMKPFGHDELAARARAAIHRSRASRPPDRMRRPRRPPIAHGDIRLDPARRHVFVSDRRVQLTEQEFHLLYVLAGQPGVVFSREGLLARIWGKNHFVTVRSVDTLDQPPAAAHRARRPPQPIRPHRSWCRLQAGRRLT